MSAQDGSFDYSLSRVDIHPQLFKEVTAQISSDKKSPKQWSSKFFCATDEGDVIYSDWFAEVKADDKETGSRVESVLTGHHGPVADIHRSPFFPDILLTVGGWSFNIWREKQSSGSLLSGSMNQAYMTSCQWSPTRPGLFFLGRSDGILEIWDLLDKCHAPSFTQTVSVSAISFIRIQNYAGNLWLELRIFWFSICRNW